MLRMQEGEGHSQLCLDRLQLEAIHKVRALSSISPSPHSVSVISEMRGLKAVEMVGGEAALILSPGSWYTDLIH